MFHQEFILKFIKFGAVGFLGMFVDFGLTFLFKEVLKFNKYIANSIGFISAATSNYIFNRIWTFQSKDPEIAIQYVKFIVISIVGLALNNFVIYILNDKFKLNFYFAKVIAIGIVTIWNFLMNYIFTF